MLTTTIHYGLLIALAIALVFAAFTDLRRRQIDNWLNAAIALAAPAFWWSSGLSLWPDVALQLGVALAAFALLAGMFALKMMGGGDVKLLTVLALWIQWDVFVQLLMVMALAGGVLTIVMGAWHVMRRHRVWRVVGAVFQSFACCRHGGSSGVNLILTSQGLLIETIPAR
jgi:prepilin peptidase CpaA